jgi:hypothetical protein
MGLNSLYNLNISMKVFVNNFSVDKLVNQVQSLDKYFKGTKTHTVVYSDDGMYVLQNNKIYKSVIVDVETTKCMTLGDFELIGDETTMTLEETHQIPPNHIMLQSTLFYYSQSPKANVQLVIEGDSKNTSFTPTDFYFEVSGDIDNYLIKEELNIFLSQLSHF